MKKIINPTRKETNKRIPRWVFALAGLAYLLAETSVLAAPPANDNYSGAITISGANVSQGGTTVDATRETGDPTTVAWPGTGANASRRSTAGDRSVWYKWTAPSTESFTITTVGASGGLDTQVGVYTGSHGSFTEIASAEDALDGSNENALGSGHSRTSFSAVSGTQYSIMVNGFESIAGAFTLTIQPGGGSTNPPPPPTGLTLNVNATGSGTVTRNPSKTSYDTNEVVTLTATPTGTNTFLGWGGDIGTNSATANPITITMDANKTVTAAFTTSGGGGGNCGESTTITISTNGNGRVTPDLSTRGNLVVCRTYRLTAMPARDWIFAGWTGVSSNQNNPRLVFEMQPNMNITANFVPNPFVPVSGVYNGLFYESTNVSTACSGSFNVRVQKTGRFTATFIRAGKRVVANGTFDANGNATGTAGRGTNALTYNLQLSGIASGDAASGGALDSDKISGTVTTAESCLAQLEGDREVFSAQNPAPLQGNYTFILPLGISESQTNEVVTTNLVVVTNNAGTTNEMVVTNEVVETNVVVTNIVANPGHSFGTIAINKQGKARISGELADGSRISQNTAVSKNGQIPLYASLYRGAGSLLGWLNVTTNDVTGTVNWERPPGSLALPNGFDADIEVMGSSFDRTRTPSITLSNGVVLITGVDPIPVQFSNNTTLSPTGGGNGLSLKLLPNGLVRGNFTSPVTSRNTPLKGAVLQNVNEAYGFYLSPGTAGAFEVGEASAPATEEPPVE